MEKILNWDMDGTIADLYGVEDWMKMRDACDSTPYKIAEALVDMYELWCVLEMFRTAGWTINIISWNSRSGDTAYHKEVRKAKVEWLEGMGILGCFDHIHVVKYGKPKNYIAKGILVDDNKEVRQRWENAGGITIDPTVANFLDILMDMVKEEM